MLAHSSFPAAPLGLKCLEKSAENQPRISEHVASPWVFQGVTDLLAPSLAGPWRGREGGGCRTVKHLCSEDAQTPGTEFQYCDHNRELDLGEVS